MSRNIKRRRTIILIIAALAMFFATGAYVAIPKGVTQMDLMTVSGEVVGEDFEVYVGTETPLSCKVAPASFMNRAVKYTLADENIATVNEEGTLTALKEGETRLTVECAGTRKNYTVKTKTAVEDITGLDEEIILYEGDEFQLEPKIKMAEEDLEKPEITYTTKRNTIADVDNKGLITAVSEGDTTITVSAGSVTKKVKVTVEAMPADTSAPAVFSTNNNSGGRSSGRASSNYSRRSNSGGGSSGSNSSGGSSDSNSGGGPSDSNSGGGSSDSISGGGSSSGSSSGDEAVNGNDRNTKRTDSDRPGGSSDGGSSGSGSSEAEE